MKKLSSIVAALALIGGLFFFTGCSKTDTTKPTLTLTGSASIDIILNSGTYHDAGCTANDDVDGDLTSSIIVTGSVNTDLAGTYTLTYSATDKAGNTGTITRNVRVYNQAEVLQGTYNVIDSTTADPNYGYIETITPSTTVNNRVLFGKFAGYNPCVVYGNKLGLTMDVPSQTILNVGNPAADRTFASTFSSIVIGTNVSMVIRYTETTGGVAAYGKGTYTKQ